MVSPSGFPAEELLSIVPPSYGQERIFLTVKIGLVFVFFLVLPLVLAKPVRVKKDKSPAIEEKSVPSTTKSKAGKTKGKKTRSSSSTLGEPSSIHEEETDEVFEVHPLANLLAAIGAPLAIAYLIFMTGPDNYYTTNTVFQAPLLTRAECQFVLDMANLAAEKNAHIADAASETNETTKQWLEHPRGWNKYRHQQYPTTDLNLVTDPFAPEHRIWLKDKLDARLAPLLRRVWGIPPSSIRANDMFVVRYDEGKRTHLANHTDNGYISINILLDEDFEGGGTRFYDRSAGKAFAYVQPQEMGQVLMHSALLNHEGVHVEKGRRTILVGFLEVDRVNPFVENLPLTGLSWYASWGSLSWLTTKLNQGHDAAHRRLRSGQHHWRNNRYIRSFMGSAQMFLNSFVSAHFQHRVYDLVDPTNRDSYLQALDTGFNEKDRASWFEGQQVVVDISGNVVAEMSSRRLNSHRFDEL